MKLCLTAIMKRIRLLGEQKSRLLSAEEEDSTVKYVDESDLVDTGYNYDKTRADVEAIDAEVLHLRSALNRANVTTPAGDSGYTIAEALVRVAQLSEKQSHLEQLPLIGRKRSVTYNGVIEYTKRLYAPEQVRRDLEKTREQISALQMAIDRANLTVEIEV